jgi:hypothetical protein
MAGQLLRRTLSGYLLGQMLDDPQLAPQLRALPAPLLRQVILQIGLEDAGELVALASLEQLREVFDEDVAEPAGTTPSTQRGSARGWCCSRPATFAADHRSSPRTSWSSPSPGCSERSTGRRWRPRSPTTTRPA